MLEFQPNSEECFAGMPKKTVRDSPRKNSRAGKSLPLRKPLASIRRASSKHSDLPKQLRSEPINQLVQFKSEFFKALASPLRIKILDELRDGERSVTELRTRLGVELANISQQLAVLKSNNMVVGRKQGNNIYYSCRDPAIFKLLDAAREIFNNHLIDVRDMLESL